MKIKKLHERFIEVEYSKLIGDKLRDSFFDSIDLFMEKFQLGKNVSGGRWYFFRMENKVSSN